MVKKSALAIEVPNTKGVALLLINFLKQDYSTKYPFKVKISFEKINNSEALTIKHLQRTQSNTWSCKKYSF